MSQRRVEHGLIHWSEGEARRRLVYVVDHDLLVLRSLAITLDLEGFAVSAFANGDGFLAAARERTPACVIIDLDMPGRSGLDLLKELNAQAYPAPILVTSGHGDIPSAVQAVKAGAHDFIEKPFDSERLVARVRAAIAEEDARRKTANEPFAAFAGAHLLTGREREVLAKIAGGASNKEAGRELGISSRTVEVHRARIMEKLDARNTADLVRIVLSDRSRSM